MDGADFLGRTSDGKRQYQNQTIRGTKSEAQKWLNDALTKKDLGIPTFQTKVSLVDTLRRGSTPLQNRASATRRSIVINGF